MRNLFRVVEELFLAQNVNFSRTKKPKKYTSLIRNACLFKSVTSKSKSITSKSI